MKGVSVTIAWGYVVEIALTGAVYLLLRTIWTKAELMDFVSATWAAWAGLTGGLLALGVAVFCTFAQLVVGEFGDWLVSRRADHIFRGAFAYVILVFFVATALLILADYTRNVVIAHLALAGIVYSAINLYSLLRNALDLLRLNHAFRKAKNDG